MSYTFLMPVYKPDYLSEAIQSILNQTYTEFKLIISDDCSPYDIETIVNKFNDPRIYFRRNSENLGGKDLVAHWNLLLNLADSEFVILAPDDDFYSNQFLEEIENLHRKYPNIDVLKSRAQDVDSLGIPYKIDPTFSEATSQVENIKNILSGNTISGIGQNVFRRSALLKIGGFVKYPIAWWSDVMTVIKLSERGIGVTKDVLFSFRHFNGNISSRKSRPAERKAKLAATLMFCKDMNEVLKTSNASENEKRYLLDTLKITKLKWIYSCAAVNSLEGNILLMHRNPDAFPSFKEKIMLFRYWITKDWMVKLVTRLRQ